MSNYKGHTKFNLLFALPLLGAGAYFLLETPWPLLLIFSGTFVYSTLFMSPDLDLAYQIRLRSLRGLFSLPFRLYARLFKHRGLSHSFLFGSLTRIGWLALWVLLLFVLITQSLPSEKTLLETWSSYRWQLLYAFGGICFADWSHLLLDRLTSK